MSCPSSPPNNGRRPPFPTHLVTPAPAAPLRQTPYVPATELVAIYRAAPRDETQIRPGDRVFLVPAYAVAVAGLETVLSRIVPRAHVTWAGRDQQNEWLYNPGGTVYAGT